MPEAGLRADGLRVGGPVRVISVIDRGSIPRIDGPSKDMLGQAGSGWRFPWRHSGWGTWNREPRARLCVSGFESVTAGQFDDPAVGHQIAECFEQPLLARTETHTDRFGR